jgi:hypothetical protein
MSVYTSRPGLRWAAALCGCGLALTLAVPALGQPFGGRGSRIPFRHPVPMMRPPHPMMATPMMMAMPMMATPHSLMPGPRALHMTSRPATLAVARTPRSTLNRAVAARERRIARESLERRIARESLARRLAAPPLYSTGTAYAGWRAVNPYALPIATAPVSGPSAPSSGYSGGPGGYSGGPGNYGMNPYGPGPYGTSPYGPDPYGYNAYLLSLAQGSYAPPAGQTDPPGQRASTSGQGSKETP